MKNVSLALFLTIVGSAYGGSIDLELRDGKLFTKHKEIGSVRLLERAPVPCPTVSPSGPVEHLVPWVEAEPHEEYEALDLITREEQLRPEARTIIRYNSQTGFLQKIAGGNGLCSMAREAVELSPEWLRPALKANLSELSFDRQKQLAGLLLEVTEPNHLDELGFLIGHIAPEQLSDERLDPGYLLRLVASLYDVDKLADYVEILDVDDGQGNFSQLALRLLEDGQEKIYQVPQEIYYWYVVHPRLDGEEVMDVSPITGGYAPYPSGRDYHSYFLDPLEGVASYVNHYLFAGQSTHGLGDISPDGLQNLEPASIGYLDGFSVDPLLITRNSSDKPTTVEFRLGKGTVLATTLVLETAWSEGKSDLLENLLRYGSGNVVQSKFAKHLVVMDEAPYGLDSVIESILEEHYVDYQVATVNELLQMDIGDIGKIVVASGQTGEFWQEISENREFLESWLTGGNWRILELHCAVGSSGEDLSDLVMPGGFSVASSSDEDSGLVSIGGQPPILELFPQAELVWDGQPHNYGSLSGNRPLDLDSIVLDRIGWWVTQNMFDNVSEYQEKHGLVERSVFPVRISKNHYGNCGELQDMVTSASRTLLVPMLNSSNSNEDHVWNEFYLLDQWHPYGVIWSDGATSIDSGEVGMDKQFGGGKDVSMVTAFRGDGKVFSVTERYSDTVDILLHLTDADGQPVEGADVMIASEAWQDDNSLVIGLWGLTDQDGNYVARVGENNNYYYRITTRFGSLPEEDNKVAMAISAVQAKAGESYTLELQLEANIDTPATPEFVTDYPTHETRVLSLDVNVPDKLLCGTGLYGGTSYCDFDGQAVVELLVLDDTNYASYQSGLEYQAIALESVSEALNVVTKAPTEDWYFVFKNAGNYHARILLDASISVLEPIETPQSDEDIVEQEDDTTTDLNEGDLSSEFQDDPPDKSSGCSHGQSTPAMTLLFLLLSLVFARLACRARQGS